MKEMFEMQKGITLIALAITIIVLVILAGVSIGMITSDNGVVKEAKNAAEESRGASVEEAKDLWLIKREGGGKQDLDGILAELEKQGLLSSQEVVEIKENENNEIKIGKRVISFKVEEETEAVNTISKTEPYVGYYADIEGDGIVDGVIYADLAIGNTGDGQWTNSDGNYDIPVVQEVKDYYVSQLNYDGKFGTKDVLSPTGAGEKRFYVMALEDIGKDYYCWYHSAIYGTMNDYNTTTFGEFGRGKNNTEVMMKKWNEKAYGKQDADSRNMKDLWGAIKEQVTNGWFVPSKAEWAAFAEELKINTKHSYSELGLKDAYWTSTQSSNSSAWRARLFINDLCEWIVGNDPEITGVYTNVRLSVIF